MREVLKEMALLALEMTAVTATAEERQFGEFSETLLDVSEHDSQLSQSDRRALSQRRAAEVLGETEDETSVFELELRAVARFRVRTSGFAYDEFASHLTECESLLETADEVDALYDSFESVHEQYDEDHVMSLHMSDGEFVRCVGALDDDVDADSLPEESRHLARELYRLYPRGFPLRDRGEESGVEGIILPSHQRDPRTRERVETKVVVYGLDAWEAWDHKESRRLSLKLFTAFNTRADVRRAALESVPLRVRRAHSIVHGAGFTMSRTYADGERRVIVAQPLLNRIESLTGRTLSAFAAALHELPRQDSSA